MANSKLTSRNRYYKIPQYIIDDMNMKLLKNKSLNSPLKNKAKSIVKHRFVSYENLKRIKNFFDSNNDIDSNLKADERQTKHQQNKNDFMFMGGNKMKNWVESQLKDLRDPIHRSKKAKSNFAGFKNEFRKEHTKSFVKAPQIPKVKSMISDLKPKKLMEGEEYSVDIPMRLKFAAICILFNEDNKLLLLKRAADDMWMPSKFALVGGTCEENETPEETIIREVKEETRLKIENPKLCYSTIEGNTFVYVFIAKTNESDKLKINKESSGYVWITEAELNKYDTVPNLSETIQKAYEILTK